MALFKINKGLAENLAKNMPYAKEGFAYFTKDDGKFYIDIDGDGTTTEAVVNVNRIPLNAAKADVALAIQATAMANDDDKVYPILAFNITDSTKNLVEAKYGQIGIKNGTLVIPNVTNKDEILISNEGSGRGIVIANSGAGNAIEVTSGKGIKVAQDPTEDLELATKQYVDNQNVVLKLTNYNFRWRDYTSYDFSLDSQEQSVYNRLTNAINKGFTPTVIITDTDEVFTYKYSFIYTVGLIQFFIFVVDLPLNNNSYHMARDFIGFQANLSNPTTLTVQRINKPAEYIPGDGETNQILSIDNNGQATWVNIPSISDLGGATKNHTHTRLTNGAVATYLNGKSLSPRNSSTVSTYAEPTTDDTPSINLGDSQHFWDSLFLSGDVYFKTTDSAGQISLTQKLEGKSDVGHTHKTSEITDLQAKLDNKSDKTHNHDSTYKKIQTAVSSPSASSTDISFIDTISQDTQGKITATKKTVRNATASQSGVVSTGAQTFGGNKTFNGTTTFKGSATFEKNVNIANGNNLFFNAGNGSTQGGIQDASYITMIDPDSGKQLTIEMPDTRTSGIYNDNTDTELHIADDNGNSVVFNFNDHKITLANYDTENRDDPISIGGIATPVEDNDSANKKYVDDKVSASFAANDAMIFKGVVNKNADLPATHETGWTYRVGTAGTYAGIVCEVGDLIICITDGISANNAHWTVAQTNIDGAVIGPTSATDNNIAIFDKATGKLIKDSGKKVSDFATASHTHTITANANDDDIVVLTGASGTNAVTYTVSHAKKGPNISTTTSKGPTTGVTVSGSGDSKSITVPKLTVDQYGHTTALSEQTLTVILPTIDDALSDSSTNPVQNKIINTALSGKSDTSHTHSYITTIGDKRTVATTPADYNNKFVFSGLKNKASVDNPSSNTYSYIMGLRGWSDSSGGLAHELAFNDTGIYTRKSKKDGTTETWDNWNRVITGSDTTGSTTQPVYISNGKPTAISYTIGKSVPSDAKFTDTVYTHPTYTAQTGVPTSNQTPGFGDTFNVSQPVSNTLGHITAINSRTITIPKTEATSSAAGLMSASDKAKLDGIASGSQANQNAFSNVKVETTTIAANTVTDTLTVAAGSNITLSSDATTKTLTIAATNTDTKVTSADNHYTPTANSGSELSADASSSTAATWNTTSLVTGVNLQRDAKGHVTGVTVDSIKMPANPNTNTHQISKNIVGASDTAKANAAATNGNVYLNHLEDTTITSKHKIVGMGGTSVTSDSSGNITINSTTYTHPTSGVAKGTYKSVTVDEQGHVTAGSNPTTLAEYGITDAKKVQTAKNSPSTNGTSLGFIDTISQDTQGVITATKKNVTIDTELDENSSNPIANKAVALKLSQFLAANDAMVFKGTIGGDAAATIHELPANHSAGETYRVYDLKGGTDLQGNSTPGYYVPGDKKCEIGDLIICIKDGTVKSGGDWTIVQTNIDGAVISSSASSTDGNIAIFDGTNGLTIKDSGKAFSNFATSDHNHDDKYLKLTGGTLTGQLNISNSDIVFNGDSESSGIWGASYLGIINTEGDYSYFGDANFVSSSGYTNTYDNTKEQQYAFHSDRLDSEIFFTFKKGKISLSSPADSLSTISLGGITTPTEDYDAVNKKYVDDKLTSKSNTGHIHQNFTAKRLNSEDLNTLLGTDKMGWYYAGGTNQVTNKPEGIDAFGLLVWQSAAGYFTQTLVGANQKSGKIYTRELWGDGVSDWITSYSEAEIDAKFEEVVHLAGAETITGVKTFDIASSGSATINPIVKFTADSTKNLFGFGTRYVSQVLYVQGMFDLATNSPVLTKTAVLGANAGTWTLNGSATSATNDSNGKKICDTYLPLAGGTMTGAINMNDNRLDNVNVIQLGVDDGNASILMGRADEIIGSHISLGDYHDYQKQLAFYDTNGNGIVLGIENGCYVPDGESKIFFQDGDGANIRLKGILEPDEDYDVANKKYVDKLATTVSDTYVKKAGDTMTGNLVIQRSNTNDTSVKCTNTNGSIGLLTSTNRGIYDYTNSKWMIYTDGTKVTTTYPLYGAVWNDYAEFRDGDTIEAGRCVVEIGDDTLITSTERMMPGANVTSDTFGFAIGETDNAKTPVAVSGRVLAYPYESREEFKKNIGRPVCSGPNGTVSIMTDEEYRNKGYCAIGTISAVPDYEEWGTGKIKVNNRVWIKVF